MAAASNGAPPEFFSTHPAHETRIADLKRWMPEALGIYERVPKASVTMLPPISGTTPPAAPAKNGARFR
jgi:hypothetical protein